MLTLGSLFDGIGGWQLAAQHAGVKPLWSSEIDEYPAEVTKIRFPETKQLGDITKLDGAELPPVDIICAGSPCQDLSIAGKREGLNGERSGLFRNAIDIVHEMRKSTGGRYPQFFVWENVTGALTSNKGADFRTVLEEIGQESIPMPDNGKWAKAGMVQFQNCQVAWRVLDAQYWGVPQRRKRIFLVADFAAVDRRATEILFVEPCVPRDSAEGERAREEVARGTGKSVDSAFVRMRSGCAGGGKVPLVSNEKSLTLATGNDLPVVHSYCIAGNTIDRKPQNGGNGTGNQEELSYTLNTVDRHAVAECFPQNAYNKFLQGTPLTTLKACGGSCGGGSENLIVNIIPSVGKVRRLTPTECERLQGLPDDFTDIEFKGKPALDSKRYKALGNGMAQPCADYVIKQIVRFVKGL